jgi:hypothetical protein
MPSGSLRCRADLTRVKSATKRPSCLYNNAWTCQYNMCDFITIVFPFLIKDILICCTWQPKVPYVTLNFRSAYSKKEGFVRQLLFALHIRLIGLRRSVVTDLSHSHLFIHSSLVVS